MDRRGFLKGMASTAGMVSCAGCTAWRWPGGTSGAPMLGAACAPIPRIRVGVVGLGARGTGAVRRLLTVPGIEITALCDVDEARIAANMEAMKAKGCPPAKVFSGVEGWKALCAYDGVNVVYNTTPWHLHAPVGIRALEEGKHAFIEVPAAMNIDECWGLVEASERAHRHCMMLENCCYGEEEMLALNMCRLGIFGTLVHGEGAYIHEMRKSLFGGRWNNWRGRWDAEHKGNAYPTHGLGPIAQCFDINHGDRFDHLVSLESDAFALPDYNASHYPASDWRHDVKIAMGDMNVTLIKTAKGRSIMVQHDVVDPQPYTRICKIVGTKGQFWGAPYVRKSAPTCRISIDDGSGNHPEYADDAATTTLMEKYRHPLWKKAGEIAKKVGGHGGMDYMMDYRWSYCLQNGLPLDMDVYDLASWSALCGLTEESVRAGSKPIDVPDFTRGAWRTAMPRTFAEKA